MPPYALDSIRCEVVDAVRAYNATAVESERIQRVGLFGSYADGCATGSSDIDLLVAFRSPAVSLFTLAKVLEEVEGRFDLEVDIVQDPPSPGSLLDIAKVVPLYEGEG